MVAVVVAGESTRWGPRDFTVSSSTLGLGAPSTHSETSGFSQTQNLSPSLIQVFRFRVLNRMPGYVLVYPINMNNSNVSPPKPKPYDGAINKHKHAISSLFAVTGLPTTIRGRRC